MDWVIPIKPRLLSAGADCSRVMVIDDNDQALTMMDARLEEAIIQTEARLVVLDPIQRFLGTDVVCTGQMKFVP